MNLRSHALSEASINQCLRKWQNGAGKAHLDDDVSNMLLPAVHLASLHISIEIDAASHHRTQPQSQALLPAIYIFSIHHSKLQLIKTLHPTIMASGSEFATKQKLSLPPQTIIHLHQKTIKLPWRARAFSPESSSSASPLKLRRVIQMQRTKTTRKLASEKLPLTTLFNYASRGQSVSVSRVLSAKWG